MMDAPQGARGAKSNRALCRNVEAQRRRKTPDCPVVLDRSVLHVFVVYSDKVIQYILLVSGFYPQY